ncbi:YciI family protein [Pseudomonas wadenswilerensis]
MAFAVIAHDYPDALERRMACREAHLGRLKALAEQGLFLGGGVLLDDDGKMIGSNVHLGFERREELEAWLEDEPYVSEKVWEKIEIREIRIFNPA